MLGGGPLVLALPGDHHHPVLALGGWDGEVLPGVRLRWDGVLLRMRGRVLLLKGFSTTTWLKMRLNILIRGRPSVRDNLVGLE